MTEIEKLHSVFDDEITLHLRRSGMTQAEFAARIPLSEVQFSRKRKGLADWKMTELVKVCEVLDKRFAEVIKDM